MKNSIIGSSNFAPITHNQSPMTNIHDLGMTDTEYAQLAAQGYDPNLELQLIELGESPHEARKLARTVGLTKDKPPETEEEWEKFMKVWEE